MIDFRTRWDAYRFDRVVESCRSAGMTDRETAYVICGGGHIAPLDDDIRAFRRWQSRGVRPSDTPGVDLLKRGKAQIESHGELCSNWVRRQSWGGDHRFGGGWEGTAYWRSFPEWFTKILLFWHPEFM